MRLFGRSVFLLFALLTHLTAYAAPADWWGTAWGARRVLTFDMSGIASNQVNIPVLVKLDPTRIDYAAVQPNGADLRFIDTDNVTVLDYEIATWNPGGVSTVWVKVPQLDANSTTDSITLYYNNPSAVAAQNPAGVWSNGYAAVWHFDSGVLDSTANANHGTNQGTTAEAGYIGNARRFNGLSTYVGVGNKPSLAIANTLTLEAWVKRDADADPSIYARILDKKLTWDANAGYSLNYYKSSNALIVASADASGGRAPSDLGNVWHYVASTLSGTQARVYVDAINLTTRSAVIPLVAGTAPLNIGRDSGGSHWDGLLDELRISNVTRTPDWFTAQQRSVTDGFVTYQTESLNSSPNVVITAPADGAIFDLSVGLSIAATANDSGGSVAQVSFLVDDAPIGTDTSAPYSISWTSPTVGGHTLTAVATDDGGLSTTSAPVNITLTPAPDGEPGGNGGNGGGTGEDPANNGGVGEPPPIVVAQWGARRVLTFDMSGIASNLVNIPVLVKLDPTRINYAAVQPNGADLRFVDADNVTVLSYEIATWNPGGVSTVWVKVPRLDANSTTDSISLYYNNPSAGAGQNPAGVWTNGYAGVWHFDSGVLDSTVNANHGTNRGTTAEAGHVGNARRFNGLSTSVGVGNKASLAFANTLTVEALTRRDADADPSVYGRIVDKKLSLTANAGFSVYYYKPSNALIVASADSSFGRAPSNLDGAWRYVASTLNGTQAQVYVDAVNVTTRSGVTPLVAGTAPLDIGRAADGSSYWDGLLDEIRISKVVRSADWITAQQRSFADRFVTYQTGAANAAPTASITAPTNGTNLVVPATLTITANAADSDGNVAQVRFFAGAVPIGTDTTAPYSIGWLSPPTGSHVLTAVATDNGSLSTTSAPVNIALTPPVQPGTTVLGIEGMRFTLNGAPTFLLGISYYGGLGASPATLSRDLDALQAHGINWLRVWGTWDSFGTNVSAVDSAGNAREPYLSRLRALVAECDRRGIVVDVTLARGPVGDVHPTDYASHQRAVSTIVEALSAHRNWYLDFANERDIAGAGYVGLDEARALRQLARTLAPDLTVTASFGGRDLLRADVVGALVTADLDFLAVHRPRNRLSPAQTEARTLALVDIVNRMNWDAPIHYQEPFRRDYATWQPTAADFLTDLQGARNGGAAGWCLHNGSARSAADGRPRRSFDLRDQSLMDQLDAVELAVLQAIDP